MGISGLIPFLKKACHEGQISELANCSVAVDASCLLHRGMFGCMDQVAVGQNTAFYIHYVRKYINVLLDQGCHVIMVFDGRQLPAKEDTNAERRARRVENLSAGHQLLSEGKTSEASEKFKRATHITPDIVVNTIKFFQPLPNVDIIVAPYEADAELAFLSREGLADAVITQDSDLIVFGCDRVFFKWDIASGTCLVYERRRLENCFTNGFKFSFEKFRRVCILAGCDYLQSGLPGVGLNKALTFFAKTSQTNPRLMLKKIPSTLMMSKLQVSDEFIEEFIRAENTFLHQVVFDPVSRIQLPLNPYPNTENKENLNCLHTPIHTYAGEVAPPKVAIELALGNGVYGGPLESLFTLPLVLSKRSVWNIDYKPLGKTLGKETTQTERFNFDRTSEKSNREPSIVKSPANIAVRGYGISMLTQTRMRNEPRLDWSVNDMLRMYSSKPNSFSQSSILSTISCSSQNPESLDEDGSNETVEDSSESEALFTSAHASNTAVWSTLSSSKPRSATRFMTSDSTLTPVRRLSVKRSIPAPDRSEKDVEADDELDPPASRKLMDEIKSFAFENSRNGKKRKTNQD